MSYNRGMNVTPRRTVVLVQLPIPPLGPDPVRGNVPLAGAYLKMWAEKQHLGTDYDIQVLPGRAANTLVQRHVNELGCS